MHLGFIIRQKSYERIVHVLRRHPVTFVPTVLLHAALLLLPFAAYWVADMLFPQIVGNATVRVIGILLFSAYLLSIILFFYTQFVIFYLDLWIVTNDRLVDIEQLGLFSRQISELDLFQIQDVTSDVNGFFPTVFHYGNLTVQTASNNVNIVLRNIPHPERLRQELLQLADADRKYHATAHQSS